MIQRLEDANVALCFHDWRELPVTGPITADFVYVRRHGTSPKRYHGSYTGAMLRKDAREICAWMRKGLDVYVYFNNDFEGHAWRNALTLKRLMGRSTDIVARQAHRSAASIASQATHFGVPEKVVAEHGILLHEDGFDVVKGTVEQHDDLPLDVGAVGCNRR